MRESSSKVIGAGESGARILESENAQTLLRQLHHRNRLPYLDSDDEPTDDQIVQFAAVLAEVLLTMRALIARMSPAAKLRMEGRELVHYQRKGQDTDLVFITVVDQLYQAFRNLWGERLFRTIETTDLRDFLTNVTMQLGDSMRDRLVDLADRYVSNLHKRNQIDLSDHAYGGVAVRSSRPGNIEFVRIISQPLEMVLITQQRKTDEFWQLVSATICPMLASTGNSAPPLADIMAIGSEQGAVPDTAAMDGPFTGIPPQPSMTLSVQPTDASLNSDLVKTLSAHTQTLEESLKQVVQEQQAMNAVVTEKLSTMVESQDAYQRGSRDDSAAALRVLTRQLETVASNQTELHHASPPTNSRLNYQGASHTTPRTGGGSRNFRNDKGPLRQQESHKERPALQPGELRWRHFTPLEYEDFCDDLKTQLRAIDISSKEDYESKRSILCNFCSRFFWLRQQGKPSDHLLENCSQAWAGSFKGMEALGEVEAMARVMRAKQQREARTRQLMVRQFFVNEDPEENTRDDVPLVADLREHLKKTRCGVSNLPSSSAPTCPSQTASGGDKG